MCKRLGKRAIRAAIKRDCAAIEEAWPVLYNTTKYARQCADDGAHARRNLAEWAAWCHETREEVCDGML